MKLAAILFIMLAAVGSALAGEVAPLRLPNAPLGEVLSYYGKLIGKKVIADNTVQGQIDLVCEQPLSPEVAATLIEKALFLNGFALIDASDDTVEVLGLGKPARSYGVPVYNDPSEFPKGERVFTYALKLQHCEALEAVGMLQQYIPPSNVTAFTPLPKSRAMLITASTSIVRSVIKALAVIDVPPTSRESRPEIHPPESKPPADKPQAQASRSAGPFILR